MKLCWPTAPTNRCPVHESGAYKAPRGEHDLLRTDWFRGFVRSGVSEMNGAKDQSKRSSSSSNGTSRRATLPTRFSTAVGSSAAGDRGAPSSASSVHQKKTRSIGSGGGNLTRLPRSPVRSHEAASDNRSTAPIYARVSGYCKPTR